MELALAFPAMVLCTAAEAFGDRMQPSLTSLRGALKHAATIETTPPASRTRALARPLESLLDSMDEAVDCLRPSDVLLPHKALLAATADALAWVAAPDPPPAFVAAARASAATHVAALTDMSHPEHAALARAATSFLDRLETYVKDHAPHPLHFVDAAVENAPTPATKAPSKARAVTPAAPAAAPAARAAAPPKPSASAARAVKTPTASSLPAQAPAPDTSSHTAAHLVRYREDVLDGPVATFERAAASVGGEPAEAAASFAAAMRAVYDFIVAASTMPTAPSDDKKQAMLAPIIRHMSDVAEVASSCAPSNALFNHVKAVEDAVGLVSWIVAEQKPTSFVSEADAAAAFSLNKVIMATRNGPQRALHKEFADSLRSVFASTKAYIKEHQTTGLQYNIGIAAKSGMDSTASPVALEDFGEDEAMDSYVTAFNRLVDGPVAAYVQAADALGGEVAEQATAFAGAWAAEAEFVAKAFQTPKPDDIQDMLAPIAGKMGEVAAITEKVDPRGPFAQHCNAIGESVAALGWVAVDEKATAFVGDMAGAGQFFLDKVKMGARKTENPDGHRTWAKAVEAMFADLKAYVKEHHTQKLVWNPPKASRAVKKSAASFSEEDAGDVSSDYVSAFRELIDGQLASFVQTSKVIGGEVAEQATAFEAAWKAEAEFLSQAINMPKPEDIQDMLTPIATKMGEVGTIVEKADPRGPIFHHLTAVGESVAALGWVAVDEKATSFVGDMAGAGQFFIDKVKMSARKTDDPDAHRTWAKALEALFAGLKAYVKEYHTQKLTWNPPKAALRRRAAVHSSEDDESPGADYVTTFKALVTGPLKSYVEAANNIGGVVAEQANAFAGAWEAEAEFLGKAINMPKPDDFQDMLAPIASKMGEVGVITEKVDPRGPFAQHCNALSESVAALGWVAVEEKATAYVGDMAGAGQFFIDKVKMGAKKTENPDAHRTWANSLETLFSGLKLYVKEHHTQRLVWNPPKKAVKTASSKSARETTATSGDYVSAFRELISGPLAMYVDASNVIGGEVAEQAGHFAGAWEAEAEFLSKAAKMPKPNDIQDMLAPIASKMGDVGAVTEKIDPRGPLAQHCNAVGESVAALGWVAVNEKATGYVGEMAGAGQFFMDKVKMSARKTDNPDAHRQWAKALEALFASLKAYVKEHHTQQLTWNKK